MTNHVHDDDLQPAAEEPTVSVKALKYHTHQGEAHAEGDVYRVPESEVGNLVAQGMVAVEPVH